MKKLLKLFKYVNSFTNNDLSAQEEADQILKFLLLKNSTVRSIEIWRALEIAMKSEMIKRQSEANYISKVVDSKWPTHIRVADRNFDKPLAELDVNYEIVKK